LSKRYLSPREENLQILALPSFFYKDRSIRWKIIDKELWFILNDIYKALRINKGKEHRELLDNEKTFIAIASWYGDKHCKAINEKGLLHIFSLKKNKEIEKFIDWVLNIVSPQIYQSGTYNPEKEEKTIYLFEN